MLLAALIVVPAFYYFGLLAGGATYPGYSHVTRYASELGAADAPFPALFNYSIIACGIATISGAAGLAGTLHDLSRRWRWAIPSGLTLALWGTGMVMGGVFPMPDERHGGFGLGFAGPLTPLFTLLALWGVPGTATLRAVLALIFAGSVVLLSIMMGVGGLVTVENVGIWQRINSGFAIPWLAVIGIWMIRCGARGGDAIPPDV
jgi:hypothetical membrane protein